MEDAAIPLVSLAQADSDKWLYGLSAMSSEGEIACLHSSVSLADKDGSILGLTENGIERLQLISQLVKLYKSVKTGRIMAMKAQDLFSATQVVTLGQTLSLASQGERLVNETPSSTKLTLEASDQCYRDLSSSAWCAPFWPAPIRQTLGTA